MKRLLVLFILFFAFNVFAQLRLSYEKVEVTLENAVDAVRSLTAPTKLEVTGTITPTTKGNFDKLVDEIKTQKNLIHLDLSKVEGLKEIESETFKDCTSLISVILPDSVRYIGEYAFSSCSNLVSVIIPDSVTTIGDVAFSDCCNLENVTLGNVTYYIGIGAFSNCNNLTNVTISNSVIIGVSAFSGCKNLVDFYVDVNNPEYSSSADGKILFNKDKTELIAYPSAAGDIAIPSNVATVGLNAFMNCSNITRVVIGNSVTTIKDGAFYKCKDLINVIIPDSVTSIGNSVFSYCENLKTVNYKGTAEQWKKISIGLGNEYLTNAIINYNYRE